MYKGIEILGANFSATAWDVKFKTLEKEKNRLKFFQIRYNSIDGFVILQGFSEKGDYQEIRNPASPQDIVDLLPIIFDWEWEEFKAAVIFFSAGYEKGKDAISNRTD